MDYHVFQLLKHITWYRLFIRTTDRNTYYDIGIKVFMHHIHRKIIINTAVIHQNTVHLYRLEDHRETHRCPYGITQTAIVAYNLTFMVYIARHTTKRHEKIVKIAIALSRIRCEKTHKLKIHRQRINQCPRQNISSHISFFAEIKLQLQHARRGLILIEIICQIPVYLASTPIMKPS